jgi:hypothetical protein
MNSMNQFERRVRALEQADTPIEGQLPTVLADDAPEAELERLRAAGVEVYRFSDGVGLFV